MLFAIQTDIRALNVFLGHFNPTPVGGGVFRPPPTEKWQFLLKMMILKSPNFVTFPIYL